MTTKDKRKHDHKEFMDIALQIGKLVQEKNEAYGSAFQVSGQVLKYFFPDGITPDKYTDLLLVARILDKLMRIASRKDAFGESPYGDIIGYGILGKWLDNQPPTDAAHVAAIAKPNGNAPLVKNEYVTPEDAEALARVIKAYSEPQTMGF